jgi:purine-binding chemotaxis protein CheW
MPEMPGTPDQNLELPGSAPLPDTTAEPPARMCVISLSGELFAIDLRHVREVFEVESVTPVPGMPSALVGVTNLRGVVMPLVDLRRMLNLPAADALPSFAVVIRHGPHQVGVLVDRVPEIRSAQRTEFLPPPTGTSGVPRSVVSALLKVEDRLSGVVEVPRLLAYTEAGEID